jgi:hypothetical protein
MQKQVWAYSGSASIAINSMRHAIQYFVRINCIFSSHGSASCLARGMPNVVFTRWYCPTDCPTDGPSDSPTLCPCSSMCSSNVRLMSDVVQHGGLSVGRSVGPFDGQLDVAMGVSEQDQCHETTLEHQ